MTMPDYRVCIYATAPSRDIAEKLGHITEGRAAVCDKAMQCREGVEYQVFTSEDYVKDLVAALKGAGFLLLGAHPPCPW